MTDIIFESFINLFQSVVVTVFLIISLGCTDCKTACRLKICTESPIYRA